VGTVSTLRQLQEATPLSPSGCSDPQWQTRSVPPDTGAPSQRWARRYLPACKAQGFSARLWALPARAVTAVTDSAGQGRPRVVQLHLL